MHKRAPHLVSKLSVNRRKAEISDFYIPPAIADLCFVNEVRFTENLCDALSCDAFGGVDELGRQEAPCGPNVATSYYRIGLDKIGKRCQPACFHSNLRTSSQTKGHDEDAHAPHTPTLRFVSGECLIVPSNILVWLRRPQARSTARYVHRLNDMKTGYTERVDKDAGKYSTSVIFENNSYTCGVFRKNYDPSTGECEKGFFEKWVLGSIIGNSFLDSMKDLYDSVATTSSVIDLPAGLDPLPETTLPEDTLEYWTNDIDESFQLPEVIDYYEKTSTSLSKRKKRSAVSKDESDDAESKGAAVGFWKKAGDIAVAFIEGFFDKDNLTQLCISEEFEFQLKQMKRRMLSVVERLLKFYGERGLNSAVGKVGRVVLEKGFASALKHIVVRVALKVVTKAAIALAKLTIGALSVVGLLTTIGTIADMILSFWDPYGYSNQLSKNVPQDLYMSAEQNLREAMRRSPTNMDMTALADLLLDEDVVNEINMKRMEDSVFYLDHLEVNSDGSWIDKGELVDLGYASGMSDTDSAVVESETNRAFAVTRSFDPSTYESTQRTFLERCRVNSILRSLAFLAGGASICLALFRWTVAALTFLVIAMGLLLSTVAAMYTDAFRITLRNVGRAFRLDDHEPYK
ncbi:hypothetical protein QAD02_001476 [Eretmocerus hayati]|uniref:Uncharacterized protein n=1 Tax=Eretmocerus hayati TaxID=131215 RepID=A0ACC2NGL2_9HYME|nr:hypothetical protein QAD02_001476 [Eretmocerus hayati]